MKKNIQPENPAWYKWPFILAYIAFAAAGTCLAMLVGPVYTRYSPIFRERR